jgi:glycosyltransferase involved in cell wall biosynthesis
MRLLFVADGRSPITLNWIGYLAGQEHDVHLVSLYPCQPVLPLAGFHRVRVRFLLAGEPGFGQGHAKDHLNLQRLLRRFTTPRVRNWVRHWLVPLRLRNAARLLRSLIAEVQPDLVHAMRIPYEGMLAALAEPDQPLLVSIWGNDFTLHAPANPWMQKLTRLTMQRASALHADCQRDLRLAYTWGFRQGCLAVVLPGNGGVQTGLFYPPPDYSISDLASPPFTVINPRGFRAYVRNDTFFRAVARVSELQPQVQFICTGMADEPQAQRWKAELPNPAAVRLMPVIPRQQLAALFRSAQVAVSITTHDGTPNSLLEAMACGCFPIAGDGESLREWIIPGQNGLLVDPGNPEALAQAILHALSWPDLRRRAAEFNTRLIADRADHRRVMKIAQNFYSQITNPGEI